MYAFYVVSSITTSQRKFSYWRDFRMNFCRKNLKKYKVVVFISIKIVILTKKYLTHIHIK